MNNCLKEIRKLESILKSKHNSALQLLYSARQYIEDSYIIEHNEFKWAKFIYYCQTGKLY